jgi:hypothetical protein
MFRGDPVTEPAPDVVASPPSEPVPLSVLELDLAAPPFGWLIELDRRHIPIILDDLGRRAISRDDAKMLLAEAAEAEAEKARRRKLAEAQAVADDQLRRAQIWPGVPADHMPPGVPPAAAMLQTARDASRNGRRRWKRRWRIRGR